MIIFTQMPHKNSECVNKTHINYRNKKKGKQKSMISVLSTDLQTHKPYELIHFIEQYIYRRVFLTGQMIQRFKEVIKVNKTKKEEKKHK